MTPTQERLRGEPYTVAAALRQAHREILTLKDGLERRTIIGQAIGITMIQTGLTSDAAFALLTRRSQNSNIKVRDLARHIVEAANAQARGQLAPETSLPRLTPARKAASQDPA